MAMCASYVVCLHVCWSNVNVQRTTSNEREHDDNGAQIKGDSIIQWTMSETSTIKEKMWYTSIAHIWSVVMLF